MYVGYQLKITIKDSHPPIWRRVIVPANITFWDLDNIIEEIFGWTHSHLYSFYSKNWDVEFSGSPIPDEEEDTSDERISEWIGEEDTFFYVYDFGDNWIHTIKVEQIV